MWSLLRMPLAARPSSGKGKLMRKKERVTDVMQNDEEQQDAQKYLYEIYLSFIHHNWPGGYSLLW